MRNKKEAKNEYISRKDLEEQTQIIIGAVDTILNKRLGEVKKELGEIKKDVGGIQKLIDNYVKAQEEFKQEFVIMKEEVRIIKNIIKEKLGMEVRAIQD